MGLNSSDSNQSSILFSSLSPLVIYLFPLLVLIPAVTIFGNVLVMLAVFRERSLRSSINYMIVNLAIADFLIAFCVMSFAVYFELNHLIWGLGEFLCNVYIAADVCCSTSSILNLVAISVDRYIAITHPVYYSKYGKRSGRAGVFIIFIWLVSIAVAVPILLGANKISNPDQECEFTNAYYIVSSSLFSFFIPCLVMLFLYAMIIHRLRQRARGRMSRGQKRRTSLKTRRKNAACGVSSALAGGAIFARDMGKRMRDRTDQIMLEATSSYPTSSSSNDEQDDDDGFLSSDPRKLTVKQPMKIYIERELSTIKPKSSNTKPFGDDLAEVFSFIDKSAGTSRVGSTRTTSAPPMMTLIVPTMSKFSSKTTLLRSNNNNELIDQQKIDRDVVDDFEFDKVIKGHKAVRPTLAGSLRLYKDELWRRLTKLKLKSNKRRMAKKEQKQIRREKKATITLAIVLAVFLVCWVPFFVLHLTNAMCMLVHGHSCVHFLAFFLTTWLGYLNSCMNPIIYTIFNPDYRRAIRRILGCVPKRHF